MLKFIIAAATDASWYGGSTASEDRTSYAIGIIGAIVFVVVGAWIWRLFANASAYDEYGRTAAQTPLWVYIGRVALFIGLLGAMQTRFEWNPNPLFLIMLSGGLVISVIAVKTGKLKRHNWRRK